MPVKRACSTLAAVAGIALIFAGVTIPATAHADGKVCNFRGKCTKKKVIKSDKKKVKVVVNTGSGKQIVITGDKKGSSSGSFKEFTCAKTASGDVSCSGVRDPKQPTATQGEDAEQIDANALAQSLIVQLQLRPIKMGVTPLAKGPDVMGLVGLPVWLWADDATRASWGPVTATAGELRLTAQVSSVTWDMGDGTRTSCGKGTEWKPGMGSRNGVALSSPTCGHTYTKQGTYTITATTNWHVEWSGYGDSGVQTLPLTATYRYVVGELQAVRVK